MLCNIETLGNPILPEELAALRLTLPDLQGRALLAWCAKRLILALEKLHQQDVLHCDIRPGNVGVTRSWSVWETILEGKTVVEPIRPVFIDYQWARMSGFHSKVAEGASILCWAYASDRALRLEAPYSDVYDVESLSQISISGVEDFENYSAILQIRDIALDTMSSEAEVEPELLAFIHHARHLSPTEAIDYTWWADVFDVTVSPEELEHFFYGR
ncbi:uncharacterized protein TRAVEDRAFT_48160 [Trametes versicolor FP-101664 SS1]|uniref:uncharacterized protein n=1 Tax=Trametes versicolor (strain FP-101664) TaxID=717944 RepID=UPI0004622F46|nr:uncharacterized protein TRAVEDRAFT_48160 [Trametes versicolor FP-101664 SS1]EIW59034.1 hypothetical protein TRAVEDRAFT_48160 [Trametes versicolor FP-101664 SS1]